MCKLYKSKITMGLLGTFKRKNGNMGQSSHVAHSTISVISQAWQLSDDSISADKHLVHKLEDLIAMRLNEGILNSLKFQHK